MLITFSCNVCCDVTLFAEPAKTFLQMLGFAQTVPVAIRAEDIATALTRLEAGLALVQKNVAETEQAMSEKRDELDEDNDVDEKPVPLAIRVLPLLKLFTAAKQVNTYVMWQAGD